MGFDGIRAALEDGIPVPCEKCGKPMLGKVIGVGGRGPRQKLYHPECYEQIKSETKGGE